MAEMPKIKKVTVTVGGKKSPPIFIPQSGDRVYDKEVEIWATERERKRMSAPAREPSKVSVADKREAIKAAMAYRDRKRDNPNRRYF